MSSGKLDFKAKVSTINVNSIRFYSDFSYPVCDLDLKKDLSGKDFSRIKYDIAELYHKAFEIHLFLLRNENLSNKEKLDFCEIERGYIKLYLKAIMKKNYITTKVNSS